MNSNLLKAKIIENGYTLKKFSEITRIKKTALYRKLSKVTEFDRKEIETIANVLKLSPEEISNIFFSRKVS